MGRAHRQGEYLLIKEQIKLNIVKHIPATDKKVLALVLACRMRTSGRKRPHKRRQGHDLQAQVQSRQDRGEKIVRFGVID